MILRKISFAFLLFLLLVGCTRNPLDVDITDISVEMDFLNVDSTLFYADSATLIESHHKFKKEIEEMYAYEIGYCLRIGDVHDSAFYNSIMQFRADTMIEKLETGIQRRFTNKTGLNRRITEGFRHLKYHFPDGKMPNHIVYINSLFNSGVFCTEKEIGIGLERFLGDSNEVVRQLNPAYYFDWMKKAMDARYLERDVLMGWISTHYLEEVDGTLAEHMVHAGKVLYLTEAAFPNEDPAIILRYSTEDYEWALDNEYPFWKYLADEKLLFKVDEKTTANMMNEGPFTPGLPDQEGPDRLGQFIGWRMIHSYMEQYDVSLKELIELPYTEILQAYEID